MCCGEWVVIFIVREQSEESCIVLYRPAADFSPDMTPVNIPRVHYGLGFRALRYLRLLNTNWCLILLYFLFSGFVCDSYDRPSHVGAY